MTTPDSLFDDPTPDPTALFPPTGRRRDGSRQPQVCTCHPPTQGHYYGPALTCLNRGCGAPYGTSTPCTRPTTPGRGRRWNASRGPVTQLSVVP